MTWEQADTERYVAEAMASGTVDAVVAAGGDGTVNEVLTAGRKIDIALPVLSLNANNLPSAWQATCCLRRFLSHESGLHMKRAQITIWAPKRDEAQQYAVQVASALVKLDAPDSLSMAVIPMGTANDFATSIGLPDDPWEALQLCTMDTAQPIDVGLVNDKVTVSIQPA